MILKLNRVECEFEFETPLFMGMSGNGLEKQKKAMILLIESQGFRCQEDGLNVKITSSSENRNMGEIAKEIAKICEAARYVILGFQEDVYNDFQMIEKSSELKILNALLS